MAADVKIEVLRQSSGTSTGTQDYTISGFGTPVAAMFIVSAATTDGTVADHNQMCIGFTDGVLNRAISNVDEHGRTTADNKRAYSEDHCILMQSNQNNAEVGVAEFSTWITDGIRINWSDAPAASYLVTCILFGGADMAADVDHVIRNTTADGTVSTTNPGFEPDLILFGCATSAAAEVAGAYGSMSFGVGWNNGGTIVQRGVGWYQDTAAVSAIEQELFTDRVAAGFGASGGGANWEGELTAISSTGFTITTRLTAAGAHRIIYLALDLGEAAGWLGAADPPTSAISSSVTGVGFTPSFAQEVHTMLPSVDTNATNGDAGAFAVSSMDGTNSFVTSWASEDNNTVSNTQQLSDNVPVNLDDHTGTAAFDATFTSFDSDGWTKSFSAADGTQRRWFGWALGTGFDPDFDAFRFYEDGTEAGSSPAAAQDINISRDSSTDPLFHFRVRIQDDGAGRDGGTSDDYRVQYSKNSGTWTTITSSSSNVQAAGTSGLSQGAATTNRATNGITDGSGSFVAGRQEENTGVINNQQLTSGDFVEHVWAFNLVDADLSNGDTIDLRLTRNADETLIRNTSTPRITITKAGGAATSPGWVQSRGGFW